MDTKKLNLRELVLQFEQVLFRKLINKEQELLVWVKKKSKELQFQAYTN